MRIIWLRLVPVAILSGPVAPVEAQSAFECPAASAQASSGIPDIAKNTQFIGDPRTDYPLIETVKQMRSKGIKNSEIVDQLIAARCPIVAANHAISDSTKKIEIRRFAANVAELVYTPHGDNIEDILLDVPVPTATFNQIKAAAKKADIGTDAWVKRALESTLRNSK